MSRPEVMASGVIAAVSVACLILPAEAIDSQPTHEQIRAALSRGKEAAQLHHSPDTFYVRFGGADDLQPSGYLITKLGSLSVLATHMALRGLEPSPSDIALATEAPTMLVSIAIFGNVPSFAVDSYMVFDQCGKTIKPVTVRFDGRAHQSAGWPNSPRFKAKVVAFFNYADFDPTAKTTITVFPANGGEVSFPLDFAQIK